MKACVFTLGCKMNEVESASLERGLEERGFEVTEELCAADLYLLNTCAVTAEAERKSRQAISRMRKFNPAAPVIVFGCAAQKNAEAFFKREGVTAVAGAQAKGKVLDLLDSKGIFLEKETAFSPLPPPKRTKTRAFLRIQDGCDRFCSYCVIPYLRGRSRSRSAESILAEARECRAKEIVLSGVDISSYRDGERDLCDLLLMLKDLPARIRLGSLEEGIVSERFLEAAKAAGVAAHFHLSVQSGSNAVLRAMNRKYTREEFLACCRKIAEYFPDGGITTDMIVGFPTEGEKEFEESLSLVEEAGFARVHVFPFSSREGTAASRYADLPGKVKRERVRRMQAAAKEAEQKFVSKFLGKVLTVLWEDGSGYTENYIRVFGNGEEGTLRKTRLLSLLPDGALGEILEENT